MIVLTEAGLIALAKAIEAVFAYQKLRLEKVAGAAEYEAEVIKPWLALAKNINAALGVKETP